MARTSRHTKKVDVVIDEVKYQTAVYARLSIEDNGIGSDSIENQIYMLKKYIKDKPYLNLCKTYFENGATGTNFNREGFNSLMNDIRSGDINCIVVKDLSRFGRNYIETGDYLDKIFPYLGVRFISVNDNFDSNDVSSNEALMVSLKSLLHDIYAKDISRKICTLFEIKKKNGEFLGRYAPYGYKKSEDDHHKLEANEDTAWVIRDIFKWKLKGIGVTAIARKLNDLGVPSQYKYLYEQGLIKGTNGERTALWRGSSVRGVLENPNYIGCIVERKSEQAHYKGGNVTLIDKSEWNIIHGTHDSIIDEETFSAVQEMIANDKAASAIKIRNGKKRKENILRGLVVCGECGSRMERDGGYYKKENETYIHRYSCPKKYVKEGACSGKSIREDELYASVFEALKVQLKVLYDAKLILDDFSQSEDFEMKKNVKSKEIVYVQSKMAKMRSLRKSLYEDYREKLLSESGYLYAKEKYENETVILSKRLDELNAELFALEEIKIPQSNNIKSALSFVDENRLTREMCLNLIEKIEVYDGKIKMFYTFTSEYESALSFINKHIYGGVKHG